MNFKHIHFIINPAAGKDEPILSLINTVFKDSGIDWDVSITKESGDAKKFAQKLIGQTDLVAVYGGDGSVSEVASGLIYTNTPMAIIAGGTANIMAKELGMPLNTLETLQLLREGLVKSKVIDMGLVNNTPFILRINFGILADMVTSADREMKKSLGQLAYGVSSIQTLTKAEPALYILEIDGKREEVSGVALCVTNSGVIGINDFSILPDISINDGLLDIILLNDADVFSLMKIAGTTLFQKESDILRHWKCKEVTISTKEPVSIICDDCEKTDSKISIKVVPSALLVVVPEIKITD